MTQVWGSFTSVANANLNGGTQSIASPVPSSESIFQRSPPITLSDLPDDEQEDEHGQEADERPEPPAPHPVVRGRGGGDPRHQRRTGIVSRD